MSSPRATVVGTITLVVVALALCASCGGSASETPFPLEPVGKEKPAPPRDAAPGGSSEASDPSEESNQGAEGAGEPESPGEPGDAAAPSTWGAPKD